MSRSRAILAFLIDAEDKGSVRWGQIKDDDIAYLVDEQRIARQLECLATVQLQAERRPLSADRGVGKASFRSQRADRPLRRVGRRRTQRSLDRGGNLIVVDGARAARAGFVKQANHSDPSKIDGATCQWCVHGCRVRQPQNCLASHQHIAGSRGIAQIATAQHDDDELASGLDRPTSHTCILASVMS